MEAEANQFAAALLMPADDIKSYFLGHRVDLQLLAALKTEWKVAMQALLIRAKSLGTITQNQAQYLWKQISARRLRLREPPELDFAPERPTVIDTILQVHTGALGYSVGELAKFLHVFEADLRDQYSLGAKPERSRFAVLK
jgi:Zn-dependent peptidase ImmA (M78 family)